MARRKQTPWREDRRILTRLPEVDALKQQGLSNAAIADELGVSETTVENDLKRITELARDESQETIRARRLIRVQELDDVADRAKKAAADHERFTRAVLFGDEVNGKRVRRNERGDAEFRAQTAALLQAERQARMDAAKLQGLVVDKAALTDSNGQALTLDQVRTVLGLGTAAEGDNGAR